MKKRTIAFLAVFFLLLALPALTIPFFSGGANTENRTLAEFPAVWTEDGFNAGFFSGLDDWLADHIGFRSLLVAANSRWQADLLGHSPEESVLVGKDGWLFYADTLNDYLNCPTLTPRAAYCAAHSLSMLQSYAEAQGATFAAVIVPNKSTLYPERMPDRFTPADADGNLELLTAAMDAEGVRYADLLPVFSSRQTAHYQTEDSHWTYQGAYLAWCELLRTLGRESRLGALDFTWRVDWDGDLAAMLYGSGAKKCPQAYPDYEFSYRVTSHEKAVDALRLTTSCETGNCSAVIYRDSFFNTAQVYAAEEFETVLFSRAYPYRAELIASQEADVCILEIVERNLPNLARKAPVMPAPEASAPQDAAPLDGEIACFSETQGDLLHLYGTLPEAVLGESYRVILETEAGCFEAFPIFEQELLGADTVGDNGFSAYLPPLTGTVTVYIVTPAAAFVCSPIILPAE